MLERVELGFEDGVEELVEESARAWDGTGLGAGGVAAAEEDFLGAIVQLLLVLRERT